MRGIRYPAPLTRIVEELVHREVLDPQYAQGLLSLIRLGNQAAHGAKIEPGAAQYAQDLAPGILASLDRKIPELKAKAQ